MWIHWLYSGKSLKIILNALVYARQSRHLKESQSEISFKNVKTP